VTVPARKIIAEIASASERVEVQVEGCQAGTVQGSRGASQEVWAAQALTPARRTGTDDAEPTLMTTS